MLLPLALPGYAAGALLTFIRVIDDLGTSLMLKLLAPQAYLRVTTVGLTDVDGYVICVVPVGLSLLALWASKAALAQGDFAQWKMGGEAPPLRLGAGGAAVAWLVAEALLGPALLPHGGIVLLSFSELPIPPPTGAGGGERAGVRGRFARPEFADAPPCPTFTDDAP